MIPTTKFSSQPKVKINLLSKPSIQVPITNKLDGMIKSCKKVFRLIKAKIIKI